LLSKGITFERTKPVVGGTSIVSVPESQVATEEEKGIKQIMEKEYFGIPFKYLALGGIGLLSLLLLTKSSTPVQPIILRA